MLIKALCDYYDILEKNGKVVSDGFSMVGIDYKIVLTPDGKIEDIINIQEEVEYVDKKGKIKKIYRPKEIQMIKRLETSTIKSNYIEHRALYIFGLNFDKKINNVNKAKKSHESFVKTNLEFIDGIESPIVNAFRNFIKNWNPDEEINNPYLINIGNKYESSKFIFTLSGYPQILLHEDPEIIKKYIEINNQEKIDSIKRQCAITGEYSELARLHGKIKGLNGGNSTGTLLVCCNNGSDNSYGNEQAFNSNISENAMMKYVEALNYLLSSDLNKAVIDDVTIVSWSMAEDSKNEDVFNMLMSNNTSVTEEKVNRNLGSLIKDVKNTILFREKLDNFNELNLGTDFYICGLKANVSRISVKFIYKMKFADIMYNVISHQNDLQIDDKVQPIMLWQIKKELVSPHITNNKKNINPSLISKIYESIIKGTKYPEELLSIVVRRMKIDVKDDLDVNDKVRVGILKAVINRKLRKLGKEEELKMSLDYNNMNQAYLCGRLFAVLEQIQQRASNNTLNRTIKDAYFSSAASTPSLIFPKVIKLSEYNLSKLNDKNIIFFNKLKCEIIDKLEGEFPRNLNLDNQGKFLVGYYQQVQEFYKKKEIKEEVEE